MAAHKHEWETLHEILPDPQAADGDVGAEHAVPYRTDFCPGCGDKRTVELTADEAVQLGIRSGRIVADELDLIGRNDS